MYTYADGWMHQWREEGDLRVRFSPEVICEQWWPGIRVWVKLDPGTLWMDEVEAFRGRRKRRSRKQSTHPILPGMNLEDCLSTPPKQDPGASADQLWKDLPADWWTLLRPVRVLPWPCIQFLSETGSAGEDLFASNKGLGWLLACKYISGGPLVRAEGVRRVRNGLGSSQREQLELLQLPKARWMVKLLRKLNMDVDPAECLRLLQKLDEEDAMRIVLQHLEQIPAKVFQLMNPKIIDVLSLPLIRDILEGTVSEIQFGGALENLKDCGELNFMGQKVPRFKSAVEMKDWLRRWERSRNEFSAQLRREKHDYPPHPFPGNDQILPIRTRALLYQEGKRMLHCVWQHDAQVKNGNMAIYQVFHPERSTLALKWNKLGFWQMFDFRLRCNEKPSIEAWTYIRQWMNMNGVKS